MSAGFQSTVNVQLGFGIPGALYDDSPVRSTPWILDSALASYNIIGATAFTVVSADPGDSSSAGVAAAGGAGTKAFAGILANAKVYSTSGPSTGALNPTLTLPNWAIGELVTMGHLIVALPGPANIGDKVCYDQTTGALATYPTTTSFTAALLTTGVLSVSAITAGMIQPGMVLSGVGVSGVAVVGYDAGNGGTGTYYTDYIGGQNITAIAMSALSLPPPSAAFTANILTTGVLSVSAVTAGQIGVGQVVYGTGVPANTTIIALGTGEGNTGTYTVSPVPSATISAEFMTNDQMVNIDRAAVIRFQPAGNGGLGVISLTGA